jgi:hypothetical protein
MKKFAVVFFLFFFNLNRQRLFPVDVARGISLGLLPRRECLVVHESWNGRQVLGVEAER